MVLSAIGQVNLISAQIESMRLKMDELASTLPEYEVVMNMFRVGHTFGPQL